MNKNLIFPGTVFVAKHYDPFNKKILSHPFVCVYDQALDDDIGESTNSNIYGLLITTQSKQMVRLVELKQKDHPFLKKDSYCYASNVYMFLKNDVEVIGQLDSDTFLKVFQKRQMMLRSESDQCILSLMNIRGKERTTNLINHLSSLVTKADQETLQTKPKETKKEKKTSKKKEEPKKDNNKKPSKKAKVKPKVEEKPNKVQENKPKSKKKKKYYYFDTKGITQ